MLLTSYECVEIVESLLWGRRIPTYSKNVYTENCRAAYLLNDYSGDMSYGTGQGMIDPAVNLVCGLSRN